LSEAYELRKHDILTVRSNGNKQLIGRSILAADVPEKTSHSGFTIRIRVTRPDVNPEYLVRYLKTGAARKALIESGDGAQISNLNQQALTALPVRLLGTQRQKALVDRLREIEAEAERLADSYKQKIDDLAELKQSILQKAFSGELKGIVSDAVIVPTAALASDIKRDTALVIALAYERHRRSNRDKSFRHTKEQKILHVVEAETGFNLGRQPIRDAAGPNDFRHMLDAEEWAEGNRYFKVSEHGTGYRFQPLARFSQFLTSANSIDPTTRKKIEHVIDVFIPMDAQEAEVFATVYAAWNNLLIEGRAPTDDDIIRAAREDWHPNKQSISRARFVEGLQRVRAAKLIPQGRGKFVPPPAQGRLDL
jgi:hypothetical protein